jgi:hypothetical protein
MADEFLCSKRLQVSLFQGPAGSAGDDPGQGTLEGMEGAFAELEGTADTGNVGFSRKKIGFGLTFAIDEVGTAELGAFAKRDGRIKIHAAEPIPEKEKKAKTHDDHPDVGPRPLEGQQPLPLGQDQALTMPVSILVKFGLSESNCEKLAAAMQLKGVGVSIGDLERWIATNEYWHRDVKGLKEKIGLVTDAFTKFRAHYPKPTAEDAERGERRDEAKRMGAEAATLEIDGGPHVDNPHPDRSVEKDGWQEGYDETMAGPAAASFRNRQKASKGTAFDK